MLVCCPNAAELQRFVLGRGTEAELARVAAHIDQCPTCLNALLTVEQRDPLVRALQSRVGKVSETDEIVVRQIIHRLIAIMPEETNSEVAAGQITLVHQPVVGPDCPTAAAGPPGACIDGQIAQILAPAQSANELGRLGPYRVLRVLGKGGMGVVFLAEDPRLGRHVALKAMLPAMVASATGKERFLREARAAARVRHDNIVVIHHVDEDRGIAFLAMEYLEGETLETRLRREGRLPLAEVLRIGQELASGLAAAHKHGLVHRDIKPANVWLEAGTGRVKVLDFGLVRANQESAQLTVAGGLLGTPPYMAPEQILDATHAEGPADLFSLGCVLYESSTGQRPFQAKDAISVLVGGQRQQPQSPDQLEAALPATFASLVMQLLNPLPTARGSGAKAVAEQLNQLATGQHAGGRPATSSSRPAASWAKTHPVLLSTAVLLPLLLLFVGGLIAVVALVVIRIRTDSGDVVTVETDDPNVELLVEKGGHLVRIRDKKSGKEWQLDPNKYTLAMADEPQGLVIELPGDRPIILKRQGQKTVTIAREKAPKSDPPLVKLTPGQRVPADELLAGNILPAALAWPGGGDAKLAPPELVAILGDGRFRVLADTAQMAQSPDGSLLAVPSQSDVMLFDTATGKYLRSFRGHTDQVYVTVFSPDGKTLASAGRDNTVKLWDVATGRPLANLTGHTNVIPGLAFSADGAFLASASDDQTAWVWNVKTGEAAQKLVGHTGIVSSVAFHPEGKMLATGSWDWTVRVWDAATGIQQQLFRVEEAKDKPGEWRDRLCVTFSADGKRLAAGNDNAVRIWDTASWKQTLFKQTPAGYVAFTPNGKTLLTGAVLAAKSLALPVKRWQADTGKLQSTLKLRSTVGGETTYHLSKDGKTLAACASGDTVVQLYDAETGQPQFPDPGHTRQLEGVAFSPDGKWLASCGRDHLIRLWDLATGKELRQFKGHTAPVRNVVFLPDGKTLASCGDDYSVRLWEPASGKLIWTFAEHTEDVVGVAASPDGKWVASASIDKTARLWHVADLAPGAVIDWNAPVHAVAFSPDGKRLGVLGEDGLCEIHEVGSGKKLRSLAQRGIGGALTFLGNDRLLTALQPGLLHEHSLAGAEVLQTVRLAAAHPARISLRSDGRLLATTGFGGAWQLWDWGRTPPQRQTIRLFPYESWIPGVAFSPEGRHVATANGDGTVYLFRFGPPGAKALPGLTRPDVVLAPAKEYQPQQEAQYWVAFANDGKKVFSASLDKTVRIWNTDTGTQLHRLTHPDKVLRLAVSPDDRYLMTSCEDKVVRIWDIAKGDEVRRLEGLHGPWNLSLSPDGGEVLTSDQNSKISIISDFKTGKEIRRFDLGGQCVWTPRGKQLLSIEGEQMCLAGADNGTVVAAMHGHRAWIRDVAISPDGLLGLSCNGHQDPSVTEAGDFWGDHSVRLWDLRSGQQLWRWQESPFSRWGVAFTPGGKRAVAGSLDGTIRVYDIATGKELACLEAPAAVHGVAVAPDGRSVLGGCSDGVLRLWRLPADVADPK